MIHDCGMLNPRGAAFCMGCGARIEAGPERSHRPETDEAEKFWKFERLIRLRAKGILSEAEYEADRARLLGPQVATLLAARNGQPSLS
jgi:hypothetical protein